MDSSIIAAVIGAIAGILGGAVGGVIGARATSKATMQAHHNNLELQEQNRKASVNGFLRSIHAELQTLLLLYEGEFKEALENLEEGEMFAYHYPLHQEYFTVYDTNGILIGQIPDDELRKVIIATYLKMKSLIDSHLHNNQMLDKYAEVQRLETIHDTSIFMEDHIAFIRKNLEAYGTEIKQNYLQLRQDVSDLLTRLDKHIELNEVPPVKRLNS